MRAAIEKLQGYKVTRLQGYNGPAGPRFFGTSGAGSADFQSAVSLISNRQTVPIPSPIGLFERPQVENLRYSRLEICATDRDGPRSGRRTGFPRGAAGFTLIEFIGVLAVIAIIACAVVASVIRRIDQATRDRETQDLSTLAQGLVQATKVDKRIPAVTGIPAVIANYRGLALSQVTTNARRFGRVIVVKSDISGNDLQSTAYVQSNTVPTTRPTSVRVMFLSTLAQPALPSVSSSDFDSIWNTPEGVVPSALGTRDVYDLKIQRLDFANRFHRVHLQNKDVNPALYTFNTNSYSTVPIGSIRTVYVLEESALNLYGSATNLQLREILIEDNSFVYQNGSWSRDLTSPKITATLGTFGNTVAQFLNATWYEPENGARPQAAIETLYNYMLAYIIWSRGDPDPAHGIPPWQGAGDNTAPQFPYFKRLNDAQAELDSVTGNLIK
jgi:prepilin-type N-terminal cleavage/methylation domain-containing protein